MKSITAILVDDEPEANRILFQQLTTSGQVQVLGMAGDVNSGLTLLNTHNPDIVFLDIDMPGKGGFDFVRQMQQHRGKAAVIFVTAYNQYAIEAIRVSAFDYLLKPVEQEELNKVLDRFQQMTLSGLELKIDRLLSELDGNHKIKLDSSGSFILVDPAEIIYCQADWNYTEVFLTGGRKEVLTMSIGKLENHLLSGRFFRISRSVIINLDYLMKVKRLLRKCILKQDGIEYSFSIPRANIRELEKKLDLG